MNILIFAHDLNYGIGKDNSLPWKISEDLKYFKEKTIGHNVLCGRKTLCSLPAHFPDREIACISTTLQPGLWGNVSVYDDIQEGFLASSEKAKKDNKHLFLIGGKTLYEKLQDKCDLLLITKIYDTFECDTFFKPDLKNCVLRNEKNVQTKNGIQITFQEYERKTK